MLFFSGIVIELDGDGDDRSAFFIIDELFAIGIERLETVFTFDPIGVGIYDFLAGICGRVNEVVVRMGTFDTFGLDVEERQGSFEGRRGTG
jgi:hypothetical protein